MTSYVIKSEDPLNLLAIIEMSEGYYQFFNMNVEKKFNFNLLKYYVFITTFDYSDFIIEEFSKVAHCFIEEFEKSEDIPYEILINTEKDKKGNLPSLHQHLDKFPNSKFHLDDILSLVVGRLEKIPKILKYFKNANPVFEMIFQIIEDKQDEFLPKFNEKIVEIETYCLNNYGVEDHNSTSCYITTFKYSLLLASIVHDRRKVIDEIFRNENFANNEIYFPKNIRVYKGSYYAAKKLLQNGYEDMFECIPTLWMPAQVYKEFLDSQISVRDGHFVEIDTKFLIHQNTKKQRIVDKNDVTQKLIFYDDTKALKKIIENEMYEDLLTHPVLSTYIKLKSYKYRRIFYLNFWIFLVMFLFYVIYVMGEVAEKNPQVELVNFRKNFISKGITILCVLMTLIYMILREGFQFKYLNEGTKFKEKLQQHLKNPSNVIESSLILSIIITVLVDVLYPSYRHLYQISVINILVMVATLSSMFPYPFMYFHMKLFQKVFLSFFKLMVAFFVWLFAFLLVLMTTFKFSMIRMKEKDSNNTEIAFFENFDQTPSAALKFLLMLSGEYTIEPYQLLIGEIVLFFIFIIFTYVLFNLIIGLTFDDVQKMRQDVLKVVMKDEIEKLNATNRVYLNYYKINK